MSNSLKNSSDVHIFLETVSIKWLQTVTRGYKCAYHTMMSFISLIMWLISPQCWFFRWITRLRVHPRESVSTRLESLNKKWIINTFGPFGLRTDTMNQQVCSFKPHSKVKKKKKKKKCVSSRSNYLVIFLFKNCFQTMWLSWKIGFLLLSLLVLFVISRGSFVDISFAYLLFSPFSSAICYCQCNTERMSIFSATFDLHNRIELTVLFSFRVCPWRQCVIVGGKSRGQTWIRSPLLKPQSFCT